MPETNKKYLDLTGLSQLVNKLRTRHELVVHPHYNSNVDAAFVKVGRDIDGHVTIGSAITASDITGLVGTINNGTLTIQAEGTTKGTFSANASSNTVINFTASDFNLTGAMNFRGVSTTKPDESGSTISGISTYAKGDVVIFKNTGETHYEEYINIAGGNTAAAWELLGDADSYALKSVVVQGDGTYITGSGSLADTTITLSHATYTTADAAAVKVGRDAGGHVVLGGALVSNTTGAHTHTITSNIPANQVVTSVSTSGTKLYTTSTSVAFVKSYSEVKSNLATTSVLGLNGSTTASKATAQTAITGLAKRASTSIAIGNANINTNPTTVITALSTTAYNASYDDTNEVLELTAITPTSTSIYGVYASDSKIYTCDATTTSITPYTFADVTVPVAASAATTVATGSLSTSGTGASVMTGLSAPTTDNALTGVSLLSSTTSSSGIEVLTGATGNKNNSTISVTSSAESAGDHKHTIS